MEEWEYWIRREKNSTLLQLFSTLQNRMRLDRHFSVRFLTIIVKGDIYKLLENWRPKHFSISINKMAEYSLLKIHRKIKRSDLKDGERNLAGEVFLFQKEGNVWHVLTYDDADFFNNATMPFFKSYYPHITNIYFSSKELKNILGSLEEKTASKIIARKSVLYTYFDRSKVDYEENPINYIFNEADDKDLLVDKMDFEVVKDTKVLLHAFTSREGYSKYSGAEVSVFNMYLDILTSAALNKFNQLNKKERKFGEDIVHPIDIVYEKDVFSGPETNRRFIENLLQMSHSDLSVYHANPYLHLSILDYLDGSTFDIFVNSSNKITIFPQFNSSFSSLLRLYNRIFEGFGEGVLIADRELTLVEGT